MKHLMGRMYREKLDELKLRYERLKEDHYRFHDPADRMIEEKDKEISKLLDDNKDLHQSLKSKPPIGFLVLSS
ncbi:hypothetical protein ACB092_02G253200 [Castanea dentata]